MIKLTIFRPRDRLHVECARAYRERDELREAAVEFTEAEMRRGGRGRETLELFAASCEGDVRGGLARAAAQKAGGA